MEKQNRILIWKRQAEPIPAYLFMLALEVIFALINTNSKNEYLKFL